MGRCSFGMAHRPFPIMSLMTKRTRWIASLAGLFAATAFLLYVTGFLGLEDASSNQERERTFVGDLVVNRSVSDSLSTHLLNPEKIVFSGDEIYISDFADHTVKVFNQDGTFVRSIGRGQGQGPGELMQVGGHDVSKDTVYIVDMMGRKVTKYASDGQFLSQFSVFHPASRIAVLNDGTVLIVGLGGDLFHAYNTDGDSLGTFGRFGGDRVLNPLAVDGNLKSRSEYDRFVFVPSYASYLHFLTPRTIEHSVRGIDGIDYPRSNSDEPQQRYTRPSVKIRQADVSLYDDKVYVLTNLPEDQAPLSYLDVYRYDTGAYLHSYRLPKRVDRVGRHGNRIYTLVKDSALATVYDLTSTP